MTRTSSVLTACLLGFSLLLVAWWTWFQVREAEQLETAGQHLAAGDPDAAARALGADDAGSLAAVGTSRRRMFLSEGLVFAAIVATAGVLLLVAMRRQRRLLADHDRFLAGATHELRTPLATIKLLLESLRDDRVPVEKRGRYLQSGLLEAERLEAGLTNVLTAAGLRSSAPRQLHRSPGDLADDVRRAVATLAARADAAGVALRVGDLPPTTTVRDADAMQLVLHNLLDNAVKYSARGGSVHVGLAHRGGEAVLSIRDDGAGMDAETLARAFTPFWRGSGNGTRGTGGTGLGLHLVRELVAAEGGVVDAASGGRGRGTEITVRLPREPAGNGREAGAR